MKQFIAKKYNRRIFPIYKGLGWDPLFYSAIIFLFLTQVKGIEPAKIMYAESIYALFRLVLYFFISMIIEKLGSRKSLMLGCFFTTVQIAMMIFIKNFVHLVIAYVFLALGTALRKTAQDVILYDATNECIGKNSFGNIDAKGASVSYAVSAISSILAGYLYVVNPYIPLILSSLISLFTILVAYRFEEINVENTKKTTFKEQLQDTKDGFIFMAQSTRLRALFLFMGIFVGVLQMISTYENSLLKDLNVKSQYFGIIFAALTMVQYFSVKLQGKIHDKFRNKTLTFLSVPIFVSFILVGIICTLNLNRIITFITVIVAFFIQHFLRAPYWTLEVKYITNFTTADIRIKILAVSRIFKGLGGIVFGFLGGLLLDYYTTSQSYIILGILGLLLISLALTYMQTRVGLKPEEYDKKDIEYSKN